MTGFPSARRTRLKREQIEPVRFAPVRKDPLKKQTRITMTQDVGGKFRRPGYRFSLSAGKSYWIDEDVADHFIIKGYATGKLSKNYSDDEQAHIRGNVQQIVLNHGVLTDG